MDSKYTMKWSNGRNKLLGLSDPHEIIIEFECLNPSNRYLLSNTSEKVIISTVPRKLYELNLKKYNPPAKLKNREVKLISDLQFNIDIAQNDSNLKSEHPDGKPFQLNECFENSKGLFFIANLLKKRNIIKPQKSIKVILGYIETGIHFGSQFGHCVIEMDNLFLHDWHVWNYIDGKLIDITVLKNGGVFNQDLKTAPKWGKAKDHVFVYPPKNVQYWGKSYKNFKTLVKDFGTVFKVDT